MIETKRIFLREYTVEDLQPLYEIFSDPETMSFWPEPFTQEQTERWIQRSMESYSKKGYGRWAVILKESGKFIGDVGIMQAEIDCNSEYDLGYIIYKGYWRKGYASEAALGCIGLAFNSLGIKRLVAIMSYDNPASSKVAEKIGMKKKDFFYKKNRDILTYLYTIEK